MRVDVTFDKDTYCRVDINTGNGNRITVYQDGTNKISIDRNYETIYDERVY